MKDGTYTIKNIEIDGVEYLEEFNSVIELEAFLNGYFYGVNKK